MSIPAQLLQRALAGHSANGFRPTALQQRAKGAYWSHYFSTGEIPPVTHNPVQAARLSGYTEVAGWWDTPGFPEWFSNGEEFRQHAEYVSTLALDVLESILRDDSARTGDRLAAARTALEIGRKFPTRGATEAASVDKQLDGMSREQLEQYISERLRVLRVPIEDDTDAPS